MESKTIFFYCDLRKLSAYFIPKSWVVSIKGWLKLNLVTSNRTGLLSVFSFLFVSGLFHFVNLGFKILRGYAKRCQRIQITIYNSIQLTRCIPLFRPLLRRPHCPWWQNPQLERGTFTAAASSLTFTASEISFWRFSLATTMAKIIETRKTVERHRRMDRKTFFILASGSYYTSYFK